MFTLFFYLSDFKRVKKVYPYEENALVLLILTVFLVRAHFFYSFFLFIRFQKSKKRVPLRLEINPPFAIDVSTFTRLRCKLHQNMSSACRLNEATKTSSQRRQSPILGVNCSNFVFPHLRVTCVFQEKCQAASSKLQRPNAA